MDTSLLITWGIPLIIGIWATMVGFGVVNKNWIIPKKRAAYKRFFRIAGILLTAYSLLAIISISYKDNIEQKNITPNPEIAQ